MTWTPGEIITAARLEDKNDKNIANGYLGLDASGFIATAQNAVVTTTHIAAANPHTNHAWCNYLTGLTPTISGWSINPSPLSEVVNEDEVAFATAGQWQYNSSALLDIDIGAIIIASISSYITVSGTGDYPNLLLLDLYISIDGVSWTSIVSLTGSSGTQFNITRALKFRYIRLYCHGTGTNEVGTLSNLSLIAR